MKTIELSGRCKEDFEKWFVNKYDSRGHSNFKDVDMGLMSQITMKWFYSMDLSMQYGVYVDLFDSVGIYVEITLAGEDVRYGVFIDENFTADEKTRTEARQKAIEKANELYNKMKTK